MNKQTILEGMALRKEYGTLCVVRDVSMTMEKGEFISIMGKSGSGKTTLLSLLSGLERPDNGRVILNGKDITAASEDELALFRRENVGFIFQSFHLIPTLSAWENVALPLFPVKMSEGKRRQRAIELLCRMEMENRVDHLPSALSGGEKQRVAIARALVNKPKIVFADEPTGNLDSSTGESIMDILKGLHAENGMSLMMVTHDPELSKNADRAIRIQDGEVIS
jgi:putative ABC transport system ATP-binding protein